MVFSSAVSVEDFGQEVRAARSGDGEAQQKLIRNFSAFIRSCARKFFLSEEDRVDLIQEGRIALFRAIQKHRSHRGPFAPYARLVIRRHVNRAAWKIIQHTAIETARELPHDIADLPVLLENRNPETVAMDEERRREIAMKVKKNLTTLECDVLALFLQGMSYREMARHLKRPAKSVDNALRRIRTKVKI